jgi:hypothetical protein
MKKLGLLVPFVLVLVVSACSSGGNESSGQAAGVTGGGGADLDSSSPAKSGAGESRSAGGGSEGGGTAVSSAVPQVGPRIIRNASLRISIQHGRFEDEVDEAHRITASFGGFVVSSSASQGSEKRLVEGTFVLRIPASSYDEAVADLRGLGKVEALDERGSDVSQEFVDLQARTRQLRAVEAQLLELLQRANDVPAALAVQSELSQVQLDLEQARGRLQYLDDQVAFATISLSMHETGVVPPKGDGFSVVEAWATAGAAFLTVVGWLFIGLAVIAPVLVLLGLGFLVGREVRKRLAHA